MLARHNRLFLARAVAWLAGQEGIRQFLDIGCGLPTVQNTHEVAQAMRPDCRVAYSTPTRWWSVMLALCCQIPVIAIRGTWPTRPASSPTGLRDLMIWPSRRRWS